jgi:hypothetical protein
MGPGGDEPGWYCAECGASVRPGLDNEKTWPASYTCNFLEAGIVSYEDVGAGVALLQKETIDTMLNSFIGKPVLIEHKNVSPQNFKNEAVGYVTAARFNEKTGWFDCDFILINDKAKKLVEDGYSVSCSFDVKNTKGGGEWHAIRYDEEITEGEFQHLALVTSPRYEDCRIMVNSKEAQIKKGEKMSKQNGLDTMSPLQRDKYLEALSDSGLQELVDNAEESEETKKLAAQHQAMRRQQKEEALLEGKSTQDKNKKNEVIKAEEAFVVMNEKEVSIADIIKQNGELTEANNALNTKVTELTKRVNDLQEMVDPKLKNAKPCEKCGEVHEGECRPKENETIGAKPGEGEPKKDNEKKDAKYFVRLNSIKEKAEDVKVAMVDTLSNKIDRGASRYGSAK